MKDQYFGDVNDYRKYGLLRAIIRVSQLRMLVAWMLTPDDGSSDGKFTSYLDLPAKWSHHDPALFQEIKQLLHSGLRREVRLIENSGLIPGAEYFSSIVPDAASERGAWFNALVDRAQDFDFVFLDPDNGFEVKSRAFGGANSSKFLYWREVEALWGAGKSLLIYQHFIREERLIFIQRMLEALTKSTPGSRVEAFSTSHVVFLMALQPQHHRFHEEIVARVQEAWSEQIQHWELTRTKAKSIGTGPRASAPIDRPAELGPAELGSD